MCVCIPWTRQASLCLGHPPLKINISNLGQIPTEPHESFMALGQTDMGPVQSHSSPLKKMQPVANYHHHLMRTGGSKKKSYTQVEKQQQMRIHIDSIEFYSSCPEHINTAAYCYNCSAGRCILLPHNRQAGNLFAS